MIKKRKELINELKCEEICVLQTTGRLKNNPEVRKMKLNKQCHC